MPTFVVIINEPHKLYVVLGKWSDDMVLVQSLFQSSMPKEVLNINDIVIVDLEEYISKLDDYGVEFLKENLSKLEI